MRARLCSTQNMRTNTQGSFPKSMTQQCYLKCRGLQRVTQARPTVGTSMITSALFDIRTTAVETKGQSSETPDCPQTEAPTKSSQRYQSHATTPSRTSRHLWTSSQLLS